MAKFISNFICCAAFSNTNLSLNTYSTTFKYLMNPSNMFDDIFKTVICVFETGGEQAKKKTETNVKEEIDSGNTP